MAQFLSDTFAGTSGDTLEAYNPAWAKVTGQTGILSINSVQRAVNTSGTALYYRSDAPAPSADYTVSGDVYVSNISAGPSASICGRMLSTAATMYRVSVVSGTGVALARSINNTSTTLITFNTTFTVGQTVALELVMSGTQISVKMDGAVVIGPVTDSNVTAAGFVGLRMLNSGANQLQIDNLAADDGAAAGVSGTAVPAGVAASASIGVATVSAGAQASLSGVAASCLVGVATASGGSASTAFPAGVAATASVTQPAARGAANGSPAGVGASSAVGAASASAGTSVPANAVVTMGIGAVASVASVGQAVGSGSAGAGPASVAAFVSVGAVIAAGTIRINGTASPAGALAYARIGTPSASAGGLFARAPDGTGYAPQRKEYQARPAQAGAVRPASIQRNNR